MQLPLPPHIDDARRSLATRHGLSPAAVAVAVSPYRVCPIGAHIDHQKGPVLGSAISLYTLLAFAPAPGAEVTVESREFPGAERFDLRAPLHRVTGWGGYLRGAAWTLAPRLPDPPRGLVGLVSGALPGGGLSSSASVLVAYLSALAAVNQVVLSERELVALARRAENEFVGVASGILDPAAVVGSRRGQLLEIDTARERWQPVAYGASGPAHRVLVAFTGTSRHLTETPFNTRVSECRAGAARIAAKLGLAGVEVLGDLPEDALDAELESLPAAERGRARHFAAERRRVRAGADAWRRGSLAEFGALMAESCRSSVENYATGSEEQIALQHILLETPGVVGARFSGAGYGGCSVAWVEAEAAGEACRRVEARFVGRFPALEGRARVFPVESDAGARLA